MIRRPATQALRRLVAAADNGILEKPHLLNRASRLAGRQQRGVQVQISSLARAFSTSRASQAKNRIYTPVRQPDELANYMLSSTSARIPLITLWTASYCSTCKVVAPLVHDLIAAGAGESADGDAVAYCEVQYDAPDMMSSGHGMQFMITSLPTLVSFDRGEVMMDTKVTDPKQMKDERWLREWIEREAKRRGGGTGGGGGGGGLFGGLFGNAKP